MFKKYIQICFLLVFAGLYAQNNDGIDLTKDKRLRRDSSNDKPKPSINLYKIYTLQKDTTFVDTTLSLKKEYKFNHLRNDSFGLMPLANEGSGYNSLYFGRTKNNALPQFGFLSKNIYYLETNDIKYYQVPTPLTELYFKTVMEQGQSLDAFVTLNTSKNFNFSIAYKALRSTGKYYNSLSSIGNFRFTTSYQTTKKNYILNAHITSQDVYNQENGGLKDVSQFESNSETYKERDRIDVYFEDAHSTLAGKRFFIDHSFVLQPEKDNSLVFLHQLKHEYKTFEFVQLTANERLGTSTSSYIQNKTRFSELFNQVGLAYSFKKYGNIQFYLQDVSYKYYYNRILSLNSLIIPSKIDDRIVNYKAQYDYKKEKLSVNASLSNSITNQSLAQMEAQANYQISDKYSIQFFYQNIQKLPNLNTQLYQSNYLNYNWNNSFKNEKINHLEAQIKNPYVDLVGQYTVLDDKIFFINEDVTKLITKPFQYDKTINYLSLKATNELKVWKLALENTVLYQSVSQSDNFLNVPEITTRNTFYFSDYLFKRAMFLQTGFTVNYFTKYYANDYNPLLAEFTVQNTTKIGNFPMIDFFVNARVRQTRIFLKAEHLNNLFSDSRTYYATPNNPYRDFMVRFGLVWNFFQ